MILELVCTTAVPDNVPSLILVWACCLVFMSRMIFLQSWCCCMGDRLLWSQEILRGGHKVGEKNSRSFSRLSRAINLLFCRLSQQKVNVIITFVKGHDDPVYPVNSCFTQIFEWRTKNTLFVTIFPWGCTELTEFRPEYSRFVATLFFLGDPAKLGLIQISRPVKWKANAVVCWEWSHLLRFVSCSTTGSKSEETGNGKWEDGGVFADKACTVRQCRRRLIFCFDFCRGQQARVFL